jgi:flagellar protein FliJ
MPKFVFKLQTLLNLKMQMEDSLKNELGKAIQKLEREKNILMQIDAEREELINKFSSESGKGIIVEKFKEYNTYIFHLKVKMELQKENINHAQKNVDRYREELIKMVQEKEMLEKLKEKKYKDFLYEQSKEEQRFNDELVSYKYNDNIAGDQDGKS